MKNINYQKTEKYSRITSKFTGKAPQNESIRHPRLLTDALFVISDAETRLLWRGFRNMVLAVGVPNNPTTVSPKQLEELNKKLSHMRHEVNNQLALVVAALELIRFRPEMRDKMLDTVGQQSPKIMAEIAKFSAEFEQTFGIVRD